MGSLEELEGRVAALETQMRTVRQDAAAARVLAGGADRDVSALATRLDAQTRLLEALRETQVEQGQQLIEQGQRLFDQGQRLFDQGDRIDSLEAEMRRGFSTLTVGQAEILALLRRKDGSEGDSPSAE
jgi:chromosome segregation ATPase